MSQFAEFDNCVMGVCNTGPFDQAKPNHTKGILSKSVKVVNIKGAYSLVSQRCNACDITQRANTANTHVTKDTCDITQHVLLKQPPKPSSLILCSLQFHWVSQTPRSQLASARQSTSPSAAVSNLWRCTPNERYYIISAPRDPPHKNGNNKVY